MNKFYNPDIAKKQLFHTKRMKLIENNFGLCTIVKVDLTDGYSTKYLLKYYEVRLSNTCIYNSI